MYKIGYLNGENVDSNVEPDKYIYLVDKIKSYDGFFLSEVAPEGLINRLLVDTNREGFYGRGRTRNHTVWFFGKRGMFQAGPNTTKYKGTLEFTGGLYERYACVKRNGVHIFGVHLKKKGREVYTNAFKSLTSLIKGTKNLKAQAEQLRNVIQNTGRLVVVGDFNATHDDRIVKVLDKSTEWHGRIRHVNEDVDHCFTRGVRAKSALQACRYSDHPLVTVIVDHKPRRPRRKPRRRNAQLDTMTKLRW